MDTSEYQAYKGICPNCAAIWRMNEIDMNHCFACGWPDDDDDNYYDDYEATIMDTLALIAYYARRYRGRELAIILHTDRALLENAKDIYWYRIGLHDELGYDRQGRSYVTIDDEWGDERWGFGAMIQRENERVYSER